MTIPGLSFEYASWAGHTVVTPVGEIDVATAPALREYLLDLLRAG